MTTANPNRLKTVEAAKYLRVSLSALAKWRMLGEGPPYHHCGPRLIQYFQHEIDAWLATCDSRDRPTSAKAR
jgi:predicted DNA-binding transcriptional regulator AlpA